MQIAASQTAASSQWQRHNTSRRFPLIILYHQTSQQIEKSSFALRHPMAKQIKLHFSLVTALSPPCKINEQCCELGVSVLPGIACSHCQPKCSSSTTIAVTLFIKNCNLCCFPTIKMISAVPWISPCQCLSPDSCMMWKDALLGNRFFSSGQTG